jgi:hypothetical protein
MSLILVSYDWHGVAAVRGSTFDPCRNSLVLRHSAGLSKPLCTRPEHCAPWVHKARTMPREEFKREVEKELTGRIR